MTKKPIFYILQRSKIRQELFRTFFKSSIGFSTLKTRYKTKSQLSGEIFKEPFIDNFLTETDQIAFRLITQTQSLQSKSTFPEANLNVISNKSINKPLHRNKLNKERSKKTTWNIYPTQPKLSIPASQQKNQNSIVSSRSNKNQEILEDLQLPLITENGDNLKKNRISKKITNKLHLYVKLGDYVSSGDKIGQIGKTPIIVDSSGKIIKISKNQILLQKTQPVLYYSQANVHVKKGDWVTQGAPILTLTHQTLVTGDIVQGIPRIEQLFEAPNSPPPGMRKGNNLHQTLHSQTREIFRQNWLKAPLPTAVRQSLQQIQQILVESIQKVYLSQGVLIADKHVEIIVRQMSSKAEVLDGGHTGLLLEELLPVQLIENANLTTPGKKALYAPAVVGLTRSALESDSFISAASFQETTRVLSRDAIIGKSDFLRGLKEKVVIGDLISAGTGLDLYFVYTLLANEHPFFKFPK